MINYAPKIRVTRPAGVAQVYDLSTITQITKARPFYDRMVIDKEMVDRSVRQDRLGYRVRAEVEFIIPNAPHADQNTLSEITTALAEDETLVELTLGNDEFGSVLYREVGGFEENVAPVENVLSILLYSWELTMRHLIPYRIEAGLAATGMW